MKLSIERLSRSVAIVLFAAVTVPAVALKQLELRLPNARAGTVPLPYVMRDNFGVTWDVQQDGTIGDGGNDLYDGAARLAVNDTGFNPQQSANFDPATNELSFAAQAIGPVQVSRRISVNAAAGWCRYAEVLANPGNQPTRVRLRLNFDMGGGVQTSTPVNDPRKNTPIGISVFDGRRAVAMLGGGAGGKVQCNFNAQPGTDQADMVFDVEIPPKQTAVIVHFQAMRPSNDQAVEFMRTAKEKELLAGLPKDIRKSVVNFRRGDAILSEIELPRAELLDIIELRSGDQYRGTLTDAVFKITGAFGDIALPAERVIGMLNAGVYQPTQLFVTTDGEIVGGRLAGDAIKVQLSSGQNIAVPLSQIAKVGCRKRPGESDEFKFDKPMLFLRDGQRLIVSAPNESISVVTLYGTLKLRPETVATLAFTGDEQPLHRVILRDGSKFSALVPGETIDISFRGAAGNGASPPSTKIPLASIERLQLLPGDVETPPDAPSLELTNGDMLTAAVTGVVEVQTGFDVIKINGGEIRAISPVVSPTDGRTIPGEAKLSLWGGATVSGRVASDSIRFTLAGGIAANIPAASIAVYENPTPSAPAPMVEQIRVIVDQLSDPDWKKRERAADQLRSIGSSAAVVLRQMRDGQPPETQKQIDTILKALENDKPKPAAPNTADLNKDAIFNKEGIIR